MESAASLVLLGVVCAGPVLAEGRANALHFGVDMNLEADDAVIARQDQQSLPAPNFVKRAVIRRAVRTAARPAGTRPISSPATRW